MKEISIVIPVLNEEKSVKQMFNEINEVVKKITHSYEIVFVDDGSWDNTFNNLVAIKDKHLKIIKLRDNFGQSSAMDAGFKNSDAKIIITMDGDLQNDPADIPKLLKKMNEGYDVASGWRYNRKDKFGKRFASIISYFIRHKLTKLPIHDPGCSLKAYKREALKGMDLTGEMHRYITDICHLKGFKVGEVVVNHRPRLYGKTKYRFTRLIKGFLDLFVIYFWQKYAKRPMHFFGGIGLLLILSGGIIDAKLIAERLIYNTRLSDRPLFVLSNFVLIMGIQFFLSGIIADIGIRNNYKITKEMNYSIEKIVRE